MWKRVGWEIQDEVAAGRGGQGRRRTCVCVFVLKPEFMVEVLSRREVGVKWTEFRCPQSNTV